jgi:hypothetical protein
MDSLIISFINILILRMPATGREAKVGVLWLEGWPSVQLLFSLNNNAEAATSREKRTMNYLAYIPAY